MNLSENIIPDVKYKFQNYFGSESVFESYIVVWFRVFKKVDFANVWFKMRGVFYQQSYPA